MNPLHVRSISRAILAVALAWIALQGCAALAPARSPTAIEAATLAVTATNAALEVAINLAPEPYDAPTWGYRVLLLKRAADAVRRGQDVCPVLPDLYSLATAVRCPRCTTLITVAKEQLECP